MLPQKHIEGLAKAFAESIPRFVVFYLASLLFLRYIWIMNQMPVSDYYFAVAVLWCWMIVWEAIGYFMSYYSKIAAFKFVCWLETKGFYNDRN